MSSIVPDMMLRDITLDRDSRVSLRRQLVGHLESRILGGQIGPGRRLPSLRRAEELLGLHRNTVASAYRDLVRSGLVRTRPGSGVYVRREDEERDSSLPRVITRGCVQLDLICRDLDLGAVLKAELQSRLSLRVRVSTRDDGLGTALRLTPSVGFVRWVRSLDKPSLVAVISRSELVRRLASLSVLIHGGEGIGYLPVSPAIHGDIARMMRLTSNVAADYAELSTARRILSREVLPLPVISSLSFTAVAATLGWFRGPGRSTARTSLAAERSLPQGVREP
jgi:DNA-binding transcriptional regulator YhcF (GntR family)